MFRLLFTPATALHSSPTGPNGTGPIQVVFPRSIKHLTSLHVSGNHFLCASLWMSLSCGVFSYCRALSLILQNMQQLQINILNIAAPLRHTRWKTHFLRHRAPAVVAEHSCEQRGGEVRSILVQLCYDFRLMWNYIGDYKTGHFSVLLEIYPTPSICSSPFPDVPCSASVLFIWFASLFLHRSLNAA